MIQAIRDQINDYCVKLPKNIPDAAIRSGLYSFALSALLTRNVDTATTTALLAATVSVVSAFTMPIFRELLADKRGSMEWHKFAITQIVSLALTQVLAKNFTSLRVNLMSSLLVTVLLNGMVNNFSSHHTNNSASFVLI